MVRPLYFFDGQFGLTDEREIFNWRDGQAGRPWAHLRVEVMRMKEFKYKEMKRTGGIPDIPGAPHGDYDPRVLKSPLQKSVAQRNHGEPTAFSSHTTTGNPD